MLCEKNFLIDEFPFLVTIARATMALAVFAILRRLLVSSVLRISESSATTHRKGVLT